MVFVADDLAAWLVGWLADAGRKKLTSLVFGREQERALRVAATVAVRRTADELRPDDAEQAEQVVLVISETFGEPVSAARLASDATVLEALQAGIVRQLAVLDDASLTGTGQSSAEVLGVAGAVVAVKLTGHLVREILSRGSRGGPLFPLASQLDHDLTYLQGQRIDGKVDQLNDKLAVVLARLDTTHAVGTAPRALGQLPAVATGFTGRADELAVLAGLLDPVGTVGSTGPVVVSAVAGLAGVGKTTLAIQAGHVAAERGWFAGGVLFIDLHGYGEVPVEPGQALDALLRALGVSAEYIPQTVDERAGLYRSVLAKISDPVLLIADNVSSEAQVRPLLPGTGRHRVVITSRHTLAGLDARLLDITVLDDAAGVELLDTVLQAARPGDGRISSDRRNATRLAQTCGGLPLALQIVAALLKGDPSLAVSEMADYLAVEQGRLEQLEYTNEAGNTPSVMAAFELSYRRLDAASARVFRLLPLNPGPDATRTTVAVLAELSSRRARDVLAGLARAHLIECAQGAPGRWRMHDLVRLYAQKLSDANGEADKREQARDRLLRYYLQSAHAADSRLRFLPYAGTKATFASWDYACDWLDAEWPNLVAAVTMAVVTGRDWFAVGIPVVLGEYFAWRRRLDEWLRILVISLERTRLLGDKLGEATALNHLGNALREMRRFEEAIAAHQDAISIYRETGDRSGQASALNNLGLALREVGRFEEAIAAHQDAAAIWRTSSDRHGDGLVKDNLGLALREVSRFEEAIAAHQDAISIYRKTGDGRREAAALNNLGLALREVGRFEEAVGVHQAAAAICHTNRDRHGEGTAQNNLGNALYSMGRFEEAMAAHHNAAAVYRETGDQHGEATALNNLGNSMQGLGRFEEAIAAYRNAVTIYKETGDQKGECGALNNLSLTLQELGRSG